MEFTEMSEAQLYCYKTALVNIMNQNNLQNLGVMYAAVTSLPQVDAKFLALTAPEISLDIDSLKELLSNYAALDDVFSERFDMFFERCIGDSTIEEIVKIEMASSKKWVESLLVSETETFKKVYEVTNGLTKPLATNEFSKIVPPVAEISLSELIHQCYQKVYT